MFKTLKHPLPSMLILFMVLATAPRIASAQSYPTDLLMTWGYQNNMAWIAYNKGDYKRAELRFHTAIKTLQKHETTDQRLLSRSYYDLALTLHAQKRYDDAEPLAVWVLEARERDPRTRDDTLFDTLYLLANIHRGQGRNAEAEAPLRRALEIEERNVTPDDPRPALTIKELAEVVARLERYGEAEMLYRRAIAIQRGYNPELNLALADALEGLADLLEDRERPDEARDAEVEARRIRAAAREAVERAQAAQTSRESFRPSSIKPATP